MASVYSFRKCAYSFRSWVADFLFLFARVPVRWNVLHHVCLGNTVVILCLDAWGHHSESSVEFSTASDGRRAIKMSCL
jgi:hypothetical protein